MGKDESQEEKGFKVQDRRRFSVEEDGSVSEREGTPKERKENGAEKKEKASFERPEQKGSAEKGEGPIGEVSFANLILSLSTSALLHLGHIENPETKKVEKNLPLAKQSIDLISVLEDKTRGNLTKQEEQLIGAVLCDLRLKYVEEKRRNS